MARKGTSTRRNWMRAWEGFIANADVSMIGRMPWADAEHLFNEGCSPKEAAKRVLGDRWPVAWGT